MFYDLVGFCSLVHDRYFNFLCCMVDMDSFLWKKEWLMAFKKVYAEDPQDEEEYQREFMRRLQRMSQEDKERRSRYLEFDEGINAPRIMPSWKGRKYLMMGWFVEFLTHYNVGAVGGRKTGVTCLQFWDEPCPVCTLFVDLNQSSNAVDLQRASDMRQQLRYMVNAVKVNKPEVVVKPWSMSSKTFDILKGKIWMDPELSRFTDPELGYDLVVNYTGKTQSNPFPQTDISVARKPSKLVVKNWQEQLKQYNLDAWLLKEKKTPQQIEAILAGERY